MLHLLGITIHENDMHPFRHKCARKLQTGESGPDNDNFFTHIFRVL